MRGDASVSDVEPKYEVVWPLGKSVTKVTALNKRLSGTEPKRIGFIWDYMFRGDQIFPLVQAGLAEKYPGSSFVPYSVFGNVHGHDEREVLAALPERLRAEKVDAVVVGVGA
jgi:hypothetical protein